MRKRFQKNATVRTIPSLTNRVFLAPKKNMEARQSDCPGLVVDHIGEAYLVRHEGAVDAAVYDGEELTSQPARWRIVYNKSGVPYFSEYPTYDIALKSTVLYKGADVEGPFYGEVTELKEGPLPTKSLFDHLTDD